MLLAGQTALVTGAGQGNGAAIAIGLAGHGAMLVCTDVNLAAAERTAASIEQRGGQACALAFDVRDKAAAEEAAKRLGQTGRNVSVLVNNAGICPRHTIDSPDLERFWQAALDVNVTGALKVTLAFLPALRATRGTVVNIASIAAYVSTATSVSYPVSKAGVRALTQSLAHELAADGIRVNAVAPGPFVTAMTKPTRDDAERSARFLSRIPLDAMASLRSWLARWRFLASSMSSYITGTTLIVDGGYLAL